MRVVQKITPRQIQRVKYMCIFALAGLVTQVFTNYAKAQIKFEEYEGPYLWQGEVFDQFQRVKNPQGYVDEYTNKETFCTSWVFHPGLSLLGDAALGICYLLLLCWLFVGIAILADIFMEAIEVITSKSELIQMLDADGKMIEIEQMFWNPTIANLTLMALGSSAPEIILSVADTMGTLGKIPSELGPQAIVGSASFNLLVISAVSIMAVKEVKPIKMLGVFFTTAVFSTFAYVWFFLVLVVISPGVVELWEACVTLGFMVLLCLIAYTCDVCHTKGETEQEKREAEHRSYVKTSLRIQLKKYGLKAMLEVGQGMKPENAEQLKMYDDVIQQIRNSFSELLTKDENFPRDCTDASTDELLEILQPENAVERNQYRKGITTKKSEFVSLEKGAKGQIQEEKMKAGNFNPKIGFKSLKYAVAESNGHVTITIEKKYKGEFSFWLRTIDGTAKAPDDYIEKNELLTMHEDQTEREIQIEIVNDPDWEPDEEFYVEILDEEKQTRMVGDDTRTTVVILDEDQAGQIGFAEVNWDVPRKDAVAYVKLERKYGTDGELTCLLNTFQDEHLLPGKKAAIPNTDFVPIEKRLIKFKAGEQDQLVRIDMPDCERKEGEDADETVSFGLQLSQPKPVGTKLGKKSTCFINIDPEDAFIPEEFERRRMLDFFTANQELSWGQQFKVACILGPSINSDDLIVEEVSCGAALWHFLSMFWKVFGAIVPPRQIWGGWLAFIIALLLIGIVTTIVGEVATVLGCVINLKPSVTGITLVAMGTSLPDTFASMTAARTSDNADSAIGNVTGSNSVNVFLGMGLPWVIAAIYWRQKDSDYAVPPGSMSFSVIMFLSCSMLCFLILGLRRCCIGGELGGEGPARPISAALLFGLWLIYVIFVSLESYGVIVVEIGDVPPPPEL